MNVDDQNTYEDVILQINSVHLIVDINFEVKLEKLFTSLT